MDASINELANIIDEQIQGNEESRNFEGESISSIVNTFLNDSINCNS